MQQSYQFNLALIQRHVDNTLVEQRQRDGYINATSMCQAAGRPFADYRRNLGTDAFLTELSTDMGIPISVLIQIVKGGNGPQGTWVHPNVAMHLAQWLSPKFAVAVAKWVHEWMAGRSPAGAPRPLPHHIQRYLANRDQVPYTHFSVLNELVLGLIAPLEALGYTLPDHMVPDISEGRMFAKWMRGRGVDTDSLPTYKHQYADGRIVYAKLYHIGFLHEFRLHFNEVWLPEKAITYFRERDPTAIAFLERMMLASPSAKQLPPQAA